MLELLDPSNYQLPNLRQFEEKLLRRQQIGQEMLALSTAESPIFIRKSIARLQNLLPDDQTVQALSRRLQAQGNDPAQVKDALQAHISETYRIYRRMLRTRRHWLSEAKDKVAARKIELKIEYEPDDTVPKRLWKLLEDWRCQVLANHTGGTARAAALETYFDFAASIASFPDRLPELISRRLAAKHDTEDERSSLLQLASIASAPEALPEPCGQYYQDHMDISCPRQNFPANAIIIASH